MSLPSQPPRLDGDDAKRRQPVWVYPLMTMFGWSIALVIFLYFGSAVRLIVLGFIAAAAVASMLKPIALRIPGPRGLSATLVGFGFILAAGGALALVSWLLVAPVQAQLNNWPQIERTLNETLALWSRRMGLEPPVTINALGRAVVSWIGETPGEVVSRTADITALAVIIVMFVFIGSIYLLAEPKGRMMRPLLAMVSERSGPALRGVLADLEPRLRWWLIGTLIGMAVVGGMSLLGFWLVGLNFAIPLALLAGLSEAVPTLGPAATFATAVLFAAGQGVAQVIGVLGVYAVVQGTESYILIPLLMRKVVSIPPIITLFTIVLWGKMFGVAGLLLAVPIDLIIWTFMDHFWVKPGEARGP